MDDVKWYKNNFRRSLVDMHIDGWNEEFLSLFDADTYFRCLQKAEIQGPMIYTHSHVGYTNWPSASGEMHPGLKGKREIERLFDLCNHAGMDVIAYYSLIYNNWAYDHYPSWRMLDINGNPSRSKAQKTHGKKDLMMEGKGRYGLVCPNNTEYRAFIHLQLEELFGHFLCKAIFLDMTFWPMICFCDSCRERFKNETNQEPPLEINWTDPLWLSFQKKREDWITEFAFYVTHEIKRIAPGVDVEHQNSTVAHSWLCGVVAGQSDASDYVGGDLYGGMEQQSFICKLYYDLTRNQPFEYMSSRCDPGLHDHTTTKSLDALKLHAYQTYAHHGAFLAIDAIDPKGTLNEAFYEKLGIVFRETKQYEPFFKGKLTADVSIYYSFLSRMDYRDREPGKIGNGGETKTNENVYLLQCVLGAAKALRRSHVPYRVFTDHRLDTFDEIKTLILSDTAFLTQEEENAFVQFVNNGGSLYMSGITSKTLAKRLLDIEIVGETQETVTYMSPTQNGTLYFEDMYTREYPLTVFGSQMLVQNSENHTVLAKTTLPYTDPKDLTAFASIHSNPPGIYTENPAVIYASCGHGHVIWAAAPIEKSDQPVHKRVFVNLINLLTAECLVCSDAPPQVEFTVFVDEDARSMQVHCVNVQEQFPIIPIPKFSVSVRVNGRAKKVRRLPDCAEVSFIYDGRGIQFTVEELQCFAMFDISLE